jgi:hypothetical protein
MKKMSRFEVLETVINGMSRKVNKKALKRALDFHNDRKNLNYALKHYYEDIHSINNGFRYYEFVSVNDFNNIDEFKTFLKGYNVKWYKTPYNYNMNNLQAIKQKNTGFVMVYSNGYYSHGSYLFDVNTFIDENDIEVMEA